jgi:lambda family phage portal protein
MPSFWQRAVSRLGLVPASAVAGQVRAAQVDAARRVAGSLRGQQRSLIAALTSNDTTTWQADGLHINAASESGLAVVRARSRDAAVNNPWGRRFVGLVLRNVLGPNGVRYQSRVRVGSTGELNKSANTRLEAAWAAWGRKGACDVTGRYTWRTVQRIVMRHWVVDGEAFVRLLPGRGPHRFQVQVLPPEMVPTSTRLDLANGHKVRQGVEVNAEGAVQAYYIRHDNPALDPLGVAEQGVSPRGLKRIPAAEMLHLFTPDEAGQLRGVPWMAAGLKSAYQAADFATAGLNKARESAKRGGWLEAMPEHVDPPSGASGAERLADGQAADGTPYQTLIDGTWDQLPYGYTAKPFESDYPNIEYGQFIKDCLRNVASGFEVSYISLGNDLEAVNYSSGQLGLEDERALWRTVQAAFAEDDFCAPVFGLWLRYALVAAPELSGLSFDRIDQYAAAAAWQCYRWAPLDREKHISAQRDAIDARISSPQREIVANGDDPDEILAEIRDWAQQTADLPAVQRPGSATQPQEPARVRLVASRDME